MTELFLLCALALPVTNSKPILTEGKNPVHEELEQLRDFIHRSHPGVEIYITEHGEHLKQFGFEQLPFRFKEGQVWIRRGA